ncbi:hypothetical protein FHS26_000531 [Rhizobium pisi]|uniref:Uncharacterized protein n=2 Tax=Rhizobium TaxID=379 RepID=A0A7W6FH41_9HYPH|nr:hypothetical protein [Rhizobium pisi]MBB3913728.1 hypothetical protein [Rhizobium fabae]
MVDGRLPRINVAEQIVGQTPLAQQAEGAYPNFGRGAFYDLEARQRITLACYG